jgi:purine-binding chemotaxis protein CheW
MSLTATPRAAVMSETDDDEDERAAGAKYLLFQLGGEVQGVAIASVTEIVEMQKVTAVPGMPSHIVGVINLRGRVIPVMDLRTRFGMPGREYDDRTCTIIARIGEISLGLVVDTVAEVQEIPDADIEPALSIGGGGSEGRFVSGLAKVGDRVVIIIDPHRLLAEGEAQVVSQAAAATKES